MPQKPFQESGSRLSRALPYVLHADGRVENSVLTVSFRNDGKAGAVFQVYDRVHLERIPRRYTVEAGHELAAHWDAGAGYDLWIIGPNGFVRELVGHKDDAAVTLNYLPAQRAVELSSEAPRALTVESRVYGPASAKAITSKLRWDVSQSGNWYDLTVKGESGFLRRFAGRLETGKDSVSDPAMA